MFVRENVKNILEIDSFVVEKVIRERKMYSSLPILFEGANNLGDDSTAPGARQLVRIRKCVAGRFWWPCFSHSLHSTNTQLLIFLNESVSPPTVCVCVCMLSRPFHKPNTACYVQWSKL